MQEENFTLEEAMAAHFAGNSIPFVMMVLRPGDQDEEARQSGT